MTDALARQAVYAACWIGFLLLLALVVRRGLRVICGPRPAITYYRCLWVLWLLYTASVVWHYTPPKS